MNGFWLIAHRYILLLGGQTKWFMLKSMLLFHQRTYQQHALPDNLIPVHFKWCFFYIHLLESNIWWQIFALVGSLSELEAV